MSIVNKEHLDEIAEKYHLNPKEHPDLFIENTMQEYCSKWIKKHITAKCNVLELGYGDGIITNELYQHCKKYSIVEGSSLICEKVKQKHPQINIYCSLFENFIPKEKFDFIIAGHVLEHVDNPVVIVKLIKNWLSKNGKLLIIVPNAESIHRELAVEMKLQEKNSDLSPRDKIVGHLRVYNLNLLKQHIKESNLEILEEKGFFLKVLPNSMMLDFPIDLIKALCRISEKFPASMLSNIGVLAGHKNN